MGISENPPIKMVNPDTIVEIKPVKSAPPVAKETITIGLDGHAPVAEKPASTVYKGGTTG